MEGRWRDTTSEWRVDDYRKVLDMTQANAEGWGAQLSEWLARDAYRHYARKRIITDLIQKEHVTTYLDVGCGSGHLISDFSSDIDVCVGVDLSKEIISYHAKNSDLLIAQAAINHLPFPDNSFDLVTCFGLVEHLLAPEKALCELLRITQPGGRAFISVPRLVGPFPLLVPLWYFTGGRYKFGWKNMVGRMYTKKHLQKQLAESGWSIQDIFPFKATSLLEWCGLPFAERIAEIFESNSIFKKSSSIMLGAICRKNLEQT